MPALAELIERYPNGTPTGTALLESCYCNTFRNATAAGV